MSSQWSVVFAWAALDWSARAVVVAAAVALVLRLARVRGGAARHAAWTAVLAAMILMPVLTSVVPTVRIPVVRTAAVHDVARPSTHALAPAGRVGGTAVLRGATPAVTHPEVPGAATDRAVSSPAPPWSWTVAVVVGWALVASLLLARLAIGWLALARIVRRSRPVHVAPPVPRAWRVRLSGEVAVPVSAGAFDRVVLVPRAWDVWPDETRRAVLAHEFAHLRRLDPLVMLAARFNRCLFWFHPLAWWLERELAAAAEEACDAAAARAVAEPRRYAALLVEMAEAVARTGRRVAWRGVGIDGSGFLERRIDRLLNGSAAEEVSVVRGVAIGLACVVAVALVVACRPQADTAPAPLEANPEVAANIARQQSLNEESAAAAAMTAAQAASLEATLLAKPDDADALKSLAVFYRVSGHKVVGWGATVAARRRHILWLIEHHPDHRVLPAWGPIHPAHDADGYAAARKAWLAQIDRNPGDVEVLSNAAYFFEVIDKRLAEELLRRASAIDPGGPTPPVVDGIYFPSWSSRLGSVYGGALLGITEGSTRIGTPSVSVQEAHSPYALEVRATLEKTGNVRLLEAVARVLTFAGRTLRSKLDFDPVALGIRYLERARALAPEEARTGSMLAQVRLSERHERVNLLLRAVPRDKQAETILALPDADRFDLLPRLVEYEYLRAENAEWGRRDAAAARAARDTTRKYAEDLLRLATAREREQHPQCGTAIVAAHLTLAALALHDGDTRLALAHLRSAADAPPSEELRLDLDSFWAVVCTGLLKRGERESVAQFLDSYARLNEVQRETLTQAAAAIRAGVMPAFYQYRTGRS